MGIGIGWNEVEYEALNENMHNRGRRVEEQVTLLRQLWTRPLVTFHGRWHNVSDAGLKSSAGPAPHPDLVRRPGRRSIKTHRKNG